MRKDTSFRRLGLERGPQEKRPQPRSCLPSGGASPGDQKSVNPPLRWDSTPTIPRPWHRPWHHGYWEGSCAADEMVAYRFPALVRPRPRRRAQRRALLLTSLRAPEVPGWRAATSGLSLLRGLPITYSWWARFTFATSCRRQARGETSGGGGGQAGAFRGATWSLPLYLNRVTILPLRLRVERCSRVWNKGKC